jgi:hypothetical protein
MKKGLKFLALILLSTISCSDNDELKNEPVNKSIYDADKYYIEVLTKYENNKNVLDFLQFKILPPINEGELEIALRTRTIKTGDSKVISYSSCGSYMPNKQSLTEAQYNDVLLVLYNKLSYSGMLYGVNYTTRTIALPKIEKGKLYRYILRNMRFELECIDEGKK